MPETQPGSNEPTRILDPREIEQRSFAIIAEGLGGKAFPPAIDPVVKRVIHTTADFDYADNLYFSPGAVESGLRALAAGAEIITDTRMAQAGINKAALNRLGATVHCHMDDPEVARLAIERGSTRATVAAERAFASPGEKIWVIGNAPTALIRLYELLSELPGGQPGPALVVAVPVGFVNVVESKELFVGSAWPCIVARGRKGGSNVAAAIINALAYQLTRD